MKFSFLKVMIVALIFGFLSGAVGALLVEAYLLPPTPYSISFQKLAEKKKPEETEASLPIEKIAPAIVDIYLTKQEKPKEILDQIYLPSDVLGRGIILTSDGWILTTREVISDFEKKYLVITFGKNLYEVKELIFDNFSEAVFLKVEAENLPVVEFGEKEELKIGQKVVAFEDGLEFTEIASLNFEPTSSKNDLIKSSERISKFILVKNVFYKAGTPFVNLKGEVIGLAVSSDSLSKENFTTVLSLSDVKNAFVDVLKYKEIKRPRLGVNYIDLASVSGLKEEISRGQKRGALLYGNKNLNIKAVLPGSPAALAGLKPGDIVLKVDKEELSSSKDLTNVIQEYKVGSSVDFLILRGGKEETITVKLEQSK